MSDSSIGDWFSSKDSLPAVRITGLPSSLLKFPPSSLPPTVPSPSQEPTFAHPFPIPSGIYNAALSANVPITIALVYASLVTYLNSVNANRKHKPWAFSRTRIFKTLVLVHNVILALYSAWTCAGMINALRLSFPGWSEADGVAGAVDSLCKLHGPRGFGSAATYNASTNLWTMTNRVFHLAADGLAPESTDVGRIWNEGLAFYGWLFYLSKFYEVIDTFIILAKGRKSTFLQTYHHAGAMMAMWAGIRYMSPPIWMFVLVNSGIHAVMYTFYFCSAIGVRVPNWFKQSLTTLQIAQFVVGATYAFLHLFISYRMPVSVPFSYHPGGITSSAPVPVSSETASTASAALETATAGIAAWFKKAAFLAAGREGLAQNVVNEQGKIFGADAIHAAKDYVTREVTGYREELQYVHCLDTSGQVFAILLNCMYLAPLTWLFARFFVNAYSKRVERRRSSTASEKAAIARQSLKDATKGVKRQVDGIVEEMHGTSEEIGNETELATSGEVKQEIRDATADTRQTLSDKTQKVQERVASTDVEKLKEDAKANVQKATDTIKTGVNKLKSMKQDREGDAPNPGAIGDQDQGDKIVTGTESNGQDQTNGKLDENEVAKTSATGEEHEAHKIPGEDTVDDTTAEESKTDADIPENAAEPEGDKSNLADSEGWDVVENENSEDVPQDGTGPSNNIDHNSSSREETSETQEHAPDEENQKPFDETTREKESSSLEHPVGEEPKADDDVDKGKADENLQETSETATNKLRQDSEGDALKSTEKSEDIKSETPAQDVTEKQGSGVEEGKEELGEEASGGAQHEKKVDDEQETGDAPNRSSENASNPHVLDSRAEDSNTVKAETESDKKEEQSEHEDSTAREETKKEMDELPGTESIPPPEQSSEVEPLHTEQEKDSKDTEVENATEKTESISDGTGGTNGTGDVTDSGPAQTDKQENDAQSSSESPAVPKDSMDEESAHNEEDSSSNKDNEQTEPQPKPASKPPSITENTAPADVDVKA